jgi:hypothetical protein
MTHGWRCWIRCIRFRPKQADWVHTRELQNRIGESAFGLKLGSEVFQFVEATAAIGQGELKELPRIDLRKVTQAELITRKTTVGMGWISEALKIHSARMLGSKSGDFGKQKSSI